MTTFTLWEAKIPYHNPELEMPNRMDFYPCEGEEKRACVLVLPGGGYSWHAPHEGEPVAQFFNSKGFHAAVLYYRVTPYRYPAALSDAQRGIRILRANADALGILPDKIVSLGFSAGGNLSASLGVLEDTAKIGDALDEISPVPNGCVLCYAALDLRDPKIASGRALFSKDLPENVERYSLQNRVTEHTPPMFLWHTSDDASVKSAHSLVFAEALRDHGVPFEMHIYPHGKHGLGLAPDKPDVSGWADLAAAWISRWI